MKKSFILILLTLTFSSAHANLNTLSKEWKQTGNTIPLDAVYPDKVAFNYVQTEQHLEQGQMSYNSRCKTYSGGSHPTYLRYEGITCSKVGSSYGTGWITKCTATLVCGNYLKTKK